jgi:alanine racemase
MKGISTEEITATIHAKAFGRKSSQRLEHLLIDSRKLVFPESTLFFSIKTEKRDGHNFIPMLYQKGVRNFVVTNQIDHSQYPEALFLFINDAIKSLQQIVAQYRKQFHYPVIGITGSNGKTIIKEWLYHLLQSQINIVRSPRSYNSQLGVPLSVWQMEESNDLAIFEAGISEKGEMEKLEQIILPTIGLITNIGEAHSDGFRSMEEKLDEKMKLFSSIQQLIYCKDHELIDYYISQHADWADSIQLISWGNSREADIRINSSEAINGTLLINFSYSGKCYSFSIPYVDYAALENAMHCIAIAVALDKLDVVLKGMNDLPPLNMRLEISQGQQDCVIINDTYNADLSGVLTAIEFLGMQGGARKKTAVLSDVAGISTEPDLLYAKIAEQMLRNNVEKVIGIGKQFQQLEDLFLRRGIVIQTFTDTEDFMRVFPFSNFRHEAVLIKGMRKFRMERISKILETKTHQTRLEVDLSAVLHNLREYRKQLKQGTGIMAMVKAFSYGAGGYEIANLLQFHKVEYLAVAYVDEGVELRRAGIHMPIMVMNTEVSAFAELVEYQLEPEIYSIEMAQAFNAFLLREGLNYFPVHIKLDTGMHRLGFVEETIDQLVELIKSASTMKVQTVFTHLVASEDPSQDPFTKAQAELFELICEKMSRALGYGFLRHAANTAAIGRFPELEYELVRLGIGLYGIDPGLTGIGLIESATLRSTIAQIKDVKSDDSVGYGRKAIMKRDSRIATIRIGYADGYPRSLGNGMGTVLIRGHYVNTVGNICMDMTMVDITDFPEIELSDEVIIFGKDLPIHGMATKAGTIPYEIMTGISQRVPRIYYGEV